MNRCGTCDAILRPEERTCYRCGDPVPDPSQSHGSGMLLAIGVPLLAFLGYWLWSGHTL